MVKGPTDHTFVHLALPYNKQISLDCFVPVYYVHGYTAHAEPPEYMETTPSFILAECERNLCDNAAKCMYMGVYVLCTDVCETAHKYVISNSNDVCFLHLVWLYHIYIMSPVTFGGSQRSCKVIRGHRPKTS